MVMFVYLRSLIQSAKISTSGTQYGFFVGAATHPQPRLTCQPKNELHTHERSMSGVCGALKKSGKSGPEPG